MDILSVLAMLVRRWYVTVPTVLLTIAGMGAAVVLSPPVYQTSGSVALLNPPVSESDTAISTAYAKNPYARFNDLSVVVDIIARTMSGAAMANKLEGLGIDDYEVTGNAHFSRGPLIEATTREPTPEESVQSSQLVLEEIKKVIAERQLSQGADPNYLITVDQIEIPSEATALYGSTIRSLIAVLALGGLCSLGLAVLVEAISTRRATNWAVRSARTGGTGGWYRAAGNLNGGRDRSVSAPADNAGIAGRWRYLKERRRAPTFPTRPQMETTPSEETPQPEPIDPRLWSRG